MPRRLSFKAVDRRTLIKAGAAAGLPPIEGGRRADLGEFAKLAEHERLVANLHRAYSELRGEPLAAPLPLAEIFAEMVEFNGGPVRCFA